MEGKRISPVLSFFHSWGKFTCRPTQLVFLDNKQQKKVTLRKSFACLAQSVEHAAVNRSVVGSSPTTGATHKRKPQKKNSKKNKKSLTDEYA